MWGRDWAERPGSLAFWRPGYLLRLGCRLSAGRHAVFSRFRQVCKAHRSRGQHARPLPRQAAPTIALSKCWPRVRIAYLADLLSSPRRSALRLANRSCRYTQAAKAKSHKAARHYRAPMVQPSGCSHPPPTISARARHYRARYCRLCCVNKADDFSGLQGAKSALG